MKYTILFDAGNHEIETSVTVRSDAREKTVYRRIALAAAHAVREKGLYHDSALSYSLDLPNLWWNEGYGRIHLYVDGTPIDGWDGRVLSFREDGLQYTY